MQNLSYSTSLIKEVIKLVLGFVEKSKNKIAERLHVRQFRRLMKSTARLCLPAGREITSLGGLSQAIGRQIISKHFIF